MAEDGKQLTLAELHERNRKPEKTPIAVRLPDPLLEDLDEFWTERGFENRSDFLRTAMRYLTENPEAFEDLTDDWHPDDEEAAAVWQRTNGESR